MIKGLMVARADGTPVYIYIPEKGSRDYQLLLSGFLTTLQIFAKGMASSGNKQIRSVTMSDERFTFRTVSLKSPAGADIDYSFVLITEPSSGLQMETKQILDCLIVGFLSFKNGEYLLKIHASPTWNISEFTEFDLVMVQTMKGWTSLRKSPGPIPCSMILAMLNEIKKYLPFDEVMQMHPHIMRIGDSYLWLSDVLSESDEVSLLDNMKESLEEACGPGMYESLIDKVRKGMPI
jgi:hypothetical protein